MEKKTYFIFFGAIILIIIIGIGIGFTSNNTIDNNIISNKTNTEEQQNTTNIIMSNDYHNYIIDTLNKVNNDNIFNIVSSRARSQYIEIDIQSKERLTYNEYDIKAKEFVHKLYEQIKAKTIKKDGWLSNDDYIINLHFYEKFNDNITPKKQTAIQVGIYQIYTKDLEKYRSYDKCVNGGISELEWQQERK